MKRGRFALWDGAWLAGMAALPAGAAAMTPTETLTCRAFAAEVAAFDAAHPGHVRTQMLRYQDVIAQVRTRVTDAGEREIAAALDDTLIDCAGEPDARLLDVLSRHRIAGDRWRE